jgi:3-deoxy-manno-octulosonate cytidylyltransferase (CMP-KDO synthetase)
MKRSGDHKVVGIIPARYDSERLPGKPLLEIGGKPMIQWVFERAQEASLVEKIVVATDDERIMKVVQQFGGDVVLTPRDISTGTDRVAFVARDLKMDIVVNIQGDEPFVDPGDIDRVANILIAHDAVMGTLVKCIQDGEELGNPNIVKVVVNKNQEALYFSRSPIPFSRDHTTFTQWMKNQHYFKHIGIYSYRNDFLHQYTQWQPTPLEQVEKLEQLRALEMGYTIRVDETTHETVSIDTPEDLEKAREIWTTFESKKRKDC